MKKSVLVLFVLLLPLPAHGMVYKWTDSAGVAHFSNKAYEIPARYRAKAKSLYPEPGDTETPLQNVQTQQTLALKASPSPVQQSKPEERVKVAQPVLVPGPRKSITAGLPPSKMKHSRNGPVE